jgi:NADH-quinone oxidoreductase subunit L
MHHDQDIRNMGGVKKYMPVTYWTSLLGSLALIGFPGFAGFFSKDAIIEAVHHSTIAGSSYAYWLVLAGVFVTALYSFRMFFLVFHGEGPRDEHAKEHIHESPKVVTVPLVLLAIPSVFLGYLTVDAMLFGDWFKDVLYVLPEHDTLAAVEAVVHNGDGMLAHIPVSWPFYLAMLGLGLAFYIYMINPSWADKIKSAMQPVYTLLDKKYWFDEIYQAVFATGSRGLGKFLWLVGDRGLIDGLAVNGSAFSVGWLASIVRHVQTGYLYHYAIAMILGLLLLLTWFVFF